MAAKAIPKVPHNNSRVIGMLTPSIIEVARQAEIGLGCAVGEGKGHRPFRWGCVAGCAVFANVMAAAESCFIVGIETSGRTLVGISPQAGGGWPCVTGFAGLGLRHMREEFSLCEVGKAVTGRTVFFSVMHRRRAVFFMALSTGFLLSMKGGEASHSLSVCVRIGIWSGLDFGRTG
jgi:hypothetical protein